MDGKFKDTFDKWLNYKRELGQPYKASSSLTECYSKLIGLSGNDPVEAQRIVDNCIAKGWRNLYPCNQNSGSSSLQPKAMSIGVCLQNNSQSKFDNQKTW